MDGGEKEFYRISTDSALTQKKQTSNLGKGLESNKLHTAQTRLITHLFSGNKGQEVFIGTVSHH